MKLSMDTKRFPGTVMQLVEEAGWKVGDTLICADDTKDRVKILDIPRKWVEEGVNRENAESIANCLRVSATGRASTMMSPTCRNWEVVTK